MVVNAIQVADLCERVRRLESNVLLLVDVMQTLIANLERKVGDGTVSDGLRQLTSAVSESEARALEEVLSREIRSGDSASAVRRLREELGCTWDQAHQLVRRWPSTPKDFRIRWIRFSRMMRFLEPISQLSSQASVADGPAEEG